MVQRRHPNLNLLLSSPEEQRACCLTWFVLGCWSSMASVLSVAPVSLELCGSPPRCYSSPPQVCRQHRAAPKPAKRFARDSRPTGGTITRGFQNRWEEFSPNKITIHIPTRTRSQYADVSFSSVLFQLALTYLLVATVGKLLFFFSPQTPHAWTLACQQLWKPSCELCLKSNSKWLQFQALLNWEKSLYIFFLFFWTSIV